MQSNNSGTRNENLRDLIGLFSAIDAAVQSLKLENGADFRQDPIMCKWYDLYQDEIRVKFDLIRPIISFGPGSDALLHRVKDEMADNLSNISFPKDIFYLKYTLRRFSGIVPYFDSDTKTDNNNYEFGDVIVPGAKFTLDIIQRHQLGKLRNEKLSLASEYIIDCYHVIFQFANILDATCLTFGIDLIQLQKETNIRLLQNRAYDVLSYYGFSQSEVLKIIGYEEKATKDSLWPLPFELGNVEETATIQPDSSTVAQKNPTQLDAITKSVSIPEKLLDGLLPILSNFFDENDRKDLRDVLLYRVKIKRKLLFTANTKNKLTHVFWKCLHPKKLIVGTQEEVAAWICLTFQHQKSACGLIEEFDEKSVLRDLQGANSRTVNPIPEIDAFFDNYP